MLHPKKQAFLKMKIKCMDVCPMNQAISFTHSTALLGLMAVLLTGCATVPTASKEARDEALSFAPHPQYAGIYVFRPKDAESGTFFEISLDHISVGELGVESFLYLPVVPGEHKISRRYTYLEACGKIHRRSWQELLFR